MSFVNRDSILLWLDTATDPASSVESRAEVWKSVKDAAKDHPRETLLHMVEIGCRVEEKMVSVDEDDKKVDDNVAIGHGGMGTVLRVCSEDTVSFAVSGAALTWALKNFKKLYRDSWAGRPVMDSIYRAIMKVLKSNYDLNESCAADGYEGSVGPSEEAVQMAETQDGEHRNNVLSLALLVMRSSGTGWSALEELPKELMSAICKEIEEARGRRKLTEEENLEIKKSAIDVVIVNATRLKTAMVLFTRFADSYYHEPIDAWVFLSGRFTSVLNVFLNCVEEWTSASSLAFDGQAAPRRDTTVMFKLLSLVLVAFNSGMVNFPDSPGVKNPEGDRAWIALLAILVKPELGERIATNPALYHLYAKGIVNKCFECMSEHLIDASSVKGKKKKIAVMKASAKRPTNSGLFNSLDVETLADTTRHAMWWVQHVANTEDIHLHQNLCYHAICYIQACSMVEAPYELCLQEEGGAFVRDALLPLLAVNHAEHEACFHDSSSTSLNAFSNYILDTIISDTDLVKVVSDCVEGLCKVHAKKYPFQDQTLLFEILGHLTECLNDASDDKLCFAALFVLHGLGEQVLPAEPQVFNQQLHDMLVTKIIPLAEDSSENTAVRYMCVRVCGQFCECPTDNTENFQRVIDFIMQCTIDETVIQVKVGGISAIATVGGHAKKARNFLRMRAASIAEEIVEVLKAFPGFIHSVAALELVVNSFGPELLPIRAKLIQELCDVFETHHQLAMEAKREEERNTENDRHDEVDDASDADDGSSRSSESNSEEDSYDDDDEDEEGTSTKHRLFMTCSALLDCLSSLVLSSEHEKEVAVEYLPAVLDLVGRMLTNPSYTTGTPNSMATALELIQHGVFVAGEPTSAESWDIVPKLYDYLVVYENPDSLGAIEAVLDNLVSFGTEQFASTPELVQQYFKMMKFILFPGDSVFQYAYTYDKTMIPQLIEAILHSCRPEPFCTSFNAHIPELVQMVGSALAANTVTVGTDGESPQDLAMWLCCNVCDLLWYNPALTMQSFGHRLGNAMGILLDTLEPILANDPESTDGQKKGKKKKASQNQGLGVENFTVPMNLLNKKVVGVGLTTFLSRLTDDISSSRGGDSSNEDYKNAVESLTPQMIVRIVETIYRCLDTAAPKYKLRVKKIRKHNANVIRKEEEGLPQHSSEFIVDDDDEDAAYSDCSTVDTDDEVEDAESSVDSDGDMPIDDPLLGVEDGMDDFSSTLDEVNEAATFSGWIQQVLAAGERKASQQEEEEEEGGKEPHVRTLFTKAMQRVMKNKRLQTIFFDGGETLSRIEEVVQDHIEELKQIAEVTKSQHDARVGALEP